MQNSRQFAAHLKVTTQTIHKLVGLGDIPKCSFKKRDGKMLISYWDDEIVKKALITRIGDFKKSEVIKLVGQKLNNKMISRRLGVSVLKIRAFLKYHDIGSHHATTSKSKEVAEPDPLAKVFRAFLFNHVEAIST